VSGYVCVCGAKDKNRHIDTYILSLLLHVLTFKPCLQPLEPPHEKIQSFRGDGQGQPCLFSLSSFLFTPHNIHLAAAACWCVCVCVCGKTRAEKETPQSARDCVRCELLSILAGEVDERLLEWVVELCMCVYMS